MALSARLLLVDRDVTAGEAFRRQLVSAGYFVELIEDSSRVMELLQTQCFDLVLLEFDLAGHSGLEVLAKIRERWGASELPVNMTADGSGRADVVTALRSGANDYVTTPLEPSIVLARIETRLKLSFADREVRRANDFYHLAMRASEEGLWDWDLLTDVMSFSERWRSMLGFSNEDWATNSQEWFSLVHPDDRQRVSSEIQAHVEGRTTSFELEYRIRHKDGRYRWMENRGSASRATDGRGIRIAGYQTDISLRKTVDPATGLPNRAWLDDEVKALGEEHTCATLLLIELDRFDRIEEHLPSGGADQLLAALGTLICKRCGVVDQLPFAAARSGASQFAILLKNTADPSLAKQLAAGIENALRTPVQVQGEPVFVIATMGIAATNDELAANDLTHCASAALRRARERAVRCEVFDSAMRQQDLEEERLIHDLSQAVDRNELVVYYQPKVDLTTQRVVGFEALARWNRPGYGLVPPTEFIIPAERTGLIVPIGRFVLDRACRDTAELRQTYPDVGVSVNISGRQLAESDLVEQVTACIEAAGLEPHALLLEITETFLVEDPEKALHMLSRLRSMGVGLKLDDFGSGYASLDYLRRFPFDTLKVDRSFVSGMSSCHESAEIVRAIAGLAQSLNMQMVAEGIETQDQLDWLKGLGCQYGQGYWFSPPVELARLKDILKRDQSVLECVTGD
jgi:PAS domain S-box-containing protein